MPGEGPQDKPEPLLLVVGPLSLLISGLRLAEGRGADDWKPVFAGQRDLVRCRADEGSGPRKARKDAGVALQGDEFHFERLWSDNPWPCADADT